MTNDDLTPIRKQYLALKNAYPDTILFFRLGDFYETFDADAETVARELDIVLTSRPIGKGQRVPLAGVPHHAVDRYLAQLIEKGYRVAVAEQMADPAAVKGIVPREVTRVVTPGTLIEPELLDEKRANYLAAWVESEGRVGLAHCDITTGEFAVTQIEPVAAAQQELLRIAPRECLYPQSAGAPLDAQAGIHFTPLPDWRFETSNARQALLDHFQVATLAGFGVEGQTLAARAAGAISQYLRETQPGALAQLAGLRTYSIGRYMALDPATRRNLELTETIRERKPQGSLLGVLDLTRTAMGGRLLRAWLSQPLLDKAELEARLDRVQVFFDDALARAGARDVLKEMPDLERAVGRVVSGSAAPRDMLAIRRALELAPELQRALSNLHARFAGSPTSNSELRTSHFQLDPCPDILDLLKSAIADEPTPPPGLIRPGYSAELDGILNASRNAKEWVANLEKTERQRTGIHALKVGYNKVFGYYIEVTHANTKAVPADYIRKQTLTNAERYITPELKEYETLILNADERLVEVENRLFKEVCSQIASRARALKSAAQAIALIDVSTALAEVAALNNYVRPELVDADEIDIANGRHPVVEKTLSETRFVPNDLQLDAETRILIITGPNMSGKSTFLRQAALIALMAQIGSFVPAERARLGLVDRIFTRIGAQDEIAAGQSTFMVEMVETANILHHATARSLIVLDEIGRGTSTYDGLSIAWAVVEYLHNHPRLKSKTLFATHYHELIALAETLPHVRNVNVAVAEEGDKVVFLHKIVPGGADRSYGIHVAQLAGLPRPVIHRAEEILQDLEQGQSKHEPAAGVQQLGLFAPENPALAELKSIDVDALSPLEALTKLYELKK
ncbi:MAG TPA: DNA mismatch repair protein MutS, partial [Anaerolineae bacterium]|nr:DNA mismatch repair protein MutS [Anaerolineae bacterium]